MSSLYEDSVACKETFAEYKQSFFPDSQKFLRTKFVEE